MPLFENQECGVKAAPSDDIRFRLPSPADGPAVTTLIAACPPLDRNSRYCNLLQCEHFAEHSIIAENSQRIIGWVSGYRPPSDPNAFFVWQVAVAAEGRGRGLANQMITQLLSRPAQRGVTHLMTTVTDDNQASWALFRGLARDWEATIERSVLFDRDAHFAGVHDTEFLAVIRPVGREKICRDETAE